jgi:ribosome-associated protein
MLSHEELKKYTEKSFVRSSGPGGQNVNKSSTRVSLVFDILRSPLRLDEKQRLLRKYPSGFIQVSNQETRSQSQNLELGFEYLHQRIAVGLFVQKPRKKLVAPHRTKSGKKTKAKNARLLKYKRRYLE